ncbi:MAG: helix-turn-helix domain-containing protein [Bacteroidota bacterium]
MATTRDDEFLKALGRRARALRKAKGMTQEGVVNASVLDLRQVGRIERGESNSTICVLKTYADALGISLKELFDFQSEE